MDATYIKKKIEQFKTTINNQLHHSTLLKYIDDPILNDEQLFYLLLPLFNGEQWDEDLNISAVTVAMVHASLNEHEKIDEYHATSKEQQLTVLSGDYYSGRYYQALANTGNVLLIREMSKGIATRCEQQIKVYEKNKLTVQDWFEYIVSIETELINKFYSVYGFDEYFKIMTNGLVLQRLQRELLNYQNGQTSTFIKMIESCLDSSDSFEKVIGQKVNKLKDQTNDFLQTSTLNDELKLYIKNQLALVQK